MPVLVKQKQKFNKITFPSPERNRKNPQRQRRIRERNPCHAKEEEREVQEESLGDQEVDLILNDPQDAS